MLNVTAVGRVAFPPEEREVGDTSVTSFKLLVNKKQKDEEIVTAIKCSVWGKRGRVVMDYINKGDQVTVSGSACVRAYLRKNQEPGAELDLRVDEFTLPPLPRKEPVIEKINI